MRSTACLSVLILSVARLCLAQDSTNAPSAAAPVHVVVIRTRTLIDGTSAQPRQNQEIVIRGDRIADVYTTGTRATPAGA